MRGQQEPRVPKRLRCDVTVSGLRHSGLVLNVSPRGLFVQTAAQASPGSEVSIDLTPPDQESLVKVRATVVWKRTVPLRMLTSARGGMGLRIQEASEGYYSFLSGVIHTGDRARPVPVEVKREALKLAKPKPAAPRKLRFRVRVSQTAGPRSRFVCVDASDPEQANSLALREVGKGWQVLEVKLG